MNEIAYLYARIMDNKTQAQLIIGTILYFWVFGP